MQNILVPKPEMRYGTKSWTIVNLNYGEKALHGATINAGIVMSFAMALTKVAMHTSLLLRLFRKRRQQMDMGCSFERN